MVRILEFPDRENRMEVAMLTVDSRISGIRATSSSSVPRPGEADHTREVRWLPLMEYSAATGVSLSTLRRHIKSRKLESRLEEGRYLLPYSGPLPSESSGGDRAVAIETGRSVSVQIDQDLVKEFETVAMEATGEIARLEAELKRSREEVAELKTLVALYEEQIFRAP